MLAPGPAERRLRLRYLILLLAAVTLASLWWRKSGHHDNLSSSTDIHLQSVNNQPKLPTPPPPQPLAVPPTPISAADAKLHVVIAHYEEEPYWIRTWLDDLRSLPVVQSLGLHITIYSKGNTRNPLDIQATTAADAVIPLPNVGREGSTYLHHILTHWDNLAPFTLFTQSYLKKSQQTSGPATGHLMDWLSTRLATTLSNTTGFMSLDRKHDICYCGHCTDMGRDDFYPLWPQLYTYITGSLCQRQQGHILSFNGHFIVSRARVHARPREVYAFLRDLVDAPADYWIHSEPEPAWFEKAKKYKSKPSDPKFGHTLERLWHTLFACDRPEVVRDCDVVGMKAEGQGGCSCLDEPPDKGIDWRGKPTEE